MKATSDFFVTCQLEPHAAGVIDMVKVLVLNATGELAHVGEGEAVEDGHWQAGLSAEVTDALEADANRFAAIIVSRREQVPITETIQFATQ